MAGKKVAAESAESKEQEVQEARSIEEAFKRLDELTGQMEEEEISLEESFRLFQEGMELVKHCGKELADVEKKMIVLEEEYQEEE